MTLHTRVAIVGDITGGDAFKLALEAICHAGGEADRIATAQISEPRTNSSGICTIGTVIGQGLPGITDCDFRVNGPLYSEDEYYERDEDDPADYEPSLATPACTVEISWDTTYGYRGPDGIGCSGLHARAISYVAGHIAKLGLTLHWFNEYECTWYSGVDDLHTLDSAGAEADTWFRSVVQPLLETIALDGLAVNE